MKHLSIIFLFISFTTVGQTFEMNVGDLMHMASVEKQSIIDHLKKQPSATIFISSVFSDSTLLNLINQYRISQDSSLKVLKHSHRLDSLANIVARYNAATNQLIHYDKIVEMQSAYDLMNIENIAHHWSYNVNVERSFKKFNIVDLKLILQGWINSPRHHENLLKKFEVGTAKVLTKIVAKGDSYNIDVYGVYETDYSYSKRDLDNKYKKANGDLLKRSTKPKISERQ